MNLISYFGCNKSDFKENSPVNKSFAGWEFNLPYFLDLGEEKGGDPRRRRNDKKGPKFVERGGGLTSVKGAQIDFSRIWTSW